MTLEELVYKRLSEYVPLTALLTKYADKAAVFFQSAPDDRQNGWKGKSQYPRLVYAIDMQANQERKSAGTMLVSLLCDEAGMIPEDIEPFVRECLKDLIINPNSASPYCFAWSRTDGFEMPTRESGANTRVIGVEIRFDILEYPAQETTDPDPVLALNRYIGEKIPEAFVLGVSHMAEFKTANGNSPVFYCRLESVEKGKETNTVVWMDGKIAVHVLCPDTDVRLKLIMSLANHLSLSGEVIMMDKSPMRIQRLQVNNRADYLKDGQLFVTVHYGLLRYKNKPHMITEVGIDFG